MSDMEGPPLDATTRALLQRAARSGAAPAGARDRVLARVEAIIGPGGPSGGSPGRSTPPSVADANWFHRLMPLVASFILGGAAGAAGLRALSRPSAPPPPRIVYVDRVIPSSVSPAATDRAAAPPATAVSSTPLPVRRSPPPTPRADLGAERQLLDVARHALDSEDGAAALAAVTEHERRFPSGVLVQEREAMAVRALVLLGRTSEARTRAARFRTRFPDSVLLPAIESAVGADSTP